MRPPGPNPAVRQLHIVLMIGMAICMVMGMEERKGTGKMTVEEAGHKGGQKVKRLIEEGERRAGEKKGEVRKR